MKGNNCKSCNRWYAEKSGYCGVCLGKRRVTCITCNKACVNRDGYCQDCDPKSFQSDHESENEYDLNDSLINDDDECSGEKTEESEFDSQNETESDDE